jgi:3-isopropylmalate/(R)-2-methylmalate dehydratase large subunit
MEERMTVCNMSIEAGARAGLIAPDETTFAWLKGRPRAPQGAAWDAPWRVGARCAATTAPTYDREVHIDASADETTVTYGTHPGMAIAMDKPFPPRPMRRNNARSITCRASRPADAGHAGRRGVRRQLHQLAPVRSARSGQACCAAASIAQGVRMLVVPGSEAVRRDAEREGLHEVFSPPVPSGACRAARCASR